MSKTKVKATFTGENLALLRELSPTIAAFDPTKESLEIRAEQLFADDKGKKGKTAKEKMYLFVKAINLGEGEPLFIEKKFGQVVVRPDISTKEEIEAILKEAGIKNTKPIFERAREHYQAKGKEGVAPKAAPAPKGKREHAPDFRGPRSGRARWYGEGAPPANFPVDWEFANDFMDEEDYQAWKRAHPKRAAEEEAYYSRMAEAARKRKESFEKEAPRVWAETHPGEEYPPRDPGWQWVPESHSWQYFRTGYNPFYNNSYWSRNRGRAAAGEGPPPPPAPAAAPSSCQDILERHGISITNPKSFRAWALSNHPDKGGDEKVFKEVSGCWTSLKRGGTRRKNKRTSKTRKN